MSIRIIIMISGWIIPGVEDGRDPGSSIGRPVLNKARPEVEEDTSRGRDCCGPRVEVGVRKVFPESGPSRPGVEAFMSRGRGLDVLGSGAFSTSGRAKLYIFIFNFMI